MGGGTLQEGDISAAAISSDNEAHLLNPHHQHSHPGVSDIDDAAAADNFTFRKPASLKPLIPLLVYVIFTAAGCSVIFPLLPRQRDRYFGSDTNAAFWKGVVDASAAAIGMFSGGVIGLASDRYGRRIVLLASCCIATLNACTQVAFSSVNPWPFLITDNLCTVIGSTKVGNAAVGFMVVADLFEPQERMLPMIVYVIALSLGVVFSPVPSALNMTDEAVAITSALVLLAVFVYVVLFFEETLPPHKRREISTSDIKNPLVPLRRVFADRYLLSFALLSISFMYPFYLGTTVSLYYLDEKFTSFSNTDNGAVTAMMAVFVVVLLILALPPLLKRMHPENVVLIGMLGMLLNAVAYCVVSAPWQVFALVPVTEATAFVGITVMSQMVSVAVSPEEQGVVNGTIAAIKEVGTILGPIGGSLLFSVGRYHMGSLGPFIQLPFVSSIAFSLIGVGVIVLMLKPLISSRRELNERNVDHVAIATTCREIDR